MELPIYNFLIEDDDTGIQKISLVEFPAVESNFFSFASNKELQKFSLNEEQHIITGCALRADFPIYRYDNIRGEFYAIFDKETIKKIAQKYSKDNAFNKINLQHSTDTDNIYVFEMYIKDVENGINPKMFEDCADGSLFVSMKVENPDVWKRIKEGEFKGFSIEGIFNLVPTPETELDNLINECLK